jgi:hypothetical protein
MRVKMSINDQWQLKCSQNLRNIGQTLVQY